MPSSRIPASEQALFQVLLLGLYPQGLTTNPEGISITKRLRKVAKAIHLLYGMEDTQ